MGAFVTIMIRAKQSIILLILLLAGTMHPVSADDGAVAKSDGGLGGEQINSDRERLQLTALLEIKNGDEVSYLVGIVDRSDDRQFTVSSQGRKFGYEVISVDVQRQEVVLARRGVTYIATMKNFGPFNVLTHQSVVKRPGVFGVSNPREAMAMDMRRARYASPLPSSADPASVKSR